MKTLKWLFRILILIILVMVGVWVYSTCSGSAIIQKIDKTLPDNTEASFEVATKTHIFLAQRAILNDDQSVTMYGWYEKDDNKWVFHEDSITLPHILHPFISRR